MRTKKILQQKKIEKKFIDWYKNRAQGERLGKKRYT